MFVPVLFVAFFVLNPCCGRIVSDLRQSEIIKVEGEEVSIMCDIDVDDEGLLVWRQGDRLLFAGNLRIRRDYRIVAIGKRFAKY